MRLSFRHRAGLLLAGAVMSTPFLAAGSSAGASATITFSGDPLLGLSTLACPSTPSQASLTVLAGTTVNFVNRTGRTATLWAGDSQKDIPDKSLVPVTFTQGPASVAVQMVPKCSLDLGKHEQMTISVESAAGTAPTHAPTSKPTVAPTTGSSGTGSATAPAGTHPSFDPSLPQHTLAATVDPTSASASPTPLAAGAGDETIAPDATGDDNPFAAASVNAEPVFGTTRGPAQPHGASGLLTLIATVGVVGVSAAAIRAIVAQRGNRPQSA
jgi:hypothetical protein